MEVIEKVKEILSKKIDISNLKEDDSLKDLGMDSLDLVETMIDIEDAIGVEFSSEEISTLNTLKDVINLIKSKNI